MAAESDARTDPEHDGSGASRKERVAAMRKKEARRQRRERTVIYGASGLAVTALVVVAAWAVLGQGGTTEKPAAPPAGASGTRTIPPPWPLPADPVAAARNAGLVVQPMQGVAWHFHSHLDILVNGKKIALPANLGIHPSGGGMSELHTHDARGVIHVEAPEKGSRYTLGQVFAEWDIRLDAKGIGGLKADGTNTLRAYVDGKQVKGNPADIELTRHRQIALVYGPAGAKVDVPAKFEFRPGE